MSGRAAGPPVSPARSIRPLPCALHDGDDRLLPPPRVPQDKYHRAERILPLIPRASRLVFPARARCALSHGPRRGARAAGEGHRLCRVQPPASRGFPFTEERALWAPARIRRHARDQRRRGRRIVSPRPHACRARLRGPLQWHRRARRGRMAEGRARDRGAGGRAF